MQKVKNPKKAAVLIFNEIFFSFTKNRIDFISNAPIVRAKETKWKETDNANIIVVKRYDFLLNK